MSQPCFSIAAFSSGLRLFFELLDEPVQRNFLAWGQGGRDALVVGAESLVVAVVERLVLDQRGARQEVELVQRGRHEILAQGVHQGQVFLDRDGQLVRPEMVEEVDQHLRLPVVAGGTLLADQRRWPPRVMAARRSSRCTSCSFLSSAPAISGTAVAVCASISAAVEPSASSRRSQSSSSDVDGFFLQARRVAQREESIQRRAQHVLLQVRIVHGHDVAHGLAVGEADVVEEAAAQESVGQVLFVVGRDDDQRTMPRRDGLARFVHVEFHAVQFAQQVVGEFDVGLVDLVDQQDHRLGRLEGLPQRALHDVVADVADLFVAQLRVAQARHRVVFIQALVGLGGGLDVPLQQRPPQRARHFLGQHGLAGAGFALDQQRTLQGEGGIDGEFQVIGGDIVVGPVEAVWRGGSSGLGCGHGLMASEI